MRIRAPNYSNFSKVPFPAATPPISHPETISPYHISIHHYLATTLARPQHVIAPCITLAAILPTTTAEPDSAAPLIFSCTYIPLQANQVLLCDLEKCLYMDTNDDDLRSNDFFVIKRSATMLAICRRLCRLPVIRIGSEDMTWKKQCVITAQRRKVGLLLGKEGTDQVLSLPTSMYY